MVYRFEVEKISQHVVKYSVDIRPPILPESGLAEIRSYGDWLVERFPGLYETVVSGHRQLRIQRTLGLPNGMRVEVPTFALMSHGPVFSFPQRLYIGSAHSPDLPEKNETFRQALSELRARFAGRVVPRVLVSHELVFDTAAVNSLEIIASDLQKDCWRTVKNLRIHMRPPVEDRNVDIAIWPTRLQHIGRDIAAVEPDGQFGIAVHVDISDPKMVRDLSEAQLNDVLSFADDYIGKGLIKFLNGEA